MEFRFKPQFVILSLLAVLIYIAMFALMEYSFFVNPFTYIITIIIFALPIINAKSKKIIIINDSGLVLSYIFGLVKYTYKWEILEECSFIKRKQNSGNSFTNNSPIQWAASKEVGSILKIIVTNDDPIIFNLKSILNSNELVKLITNKVRFIK